MEGKELNNEDEENDKKKSGNEDDSDNFGLPEIDGTSEKNKELDDPFANTWDEKKDEDQPIFSTSSDEYSEKEESYTSDYTYEEKHEEPVEPHEEYKSSSYYEETYGQKKSPVGWIIALVLFLIAIAAGAIWYFTMGKEEPPVRTEQVTQQPIVEPEPEPEPVKPKEPEKVAGVYELEKPNGRYHVIVASSIDKDLIRDYAFKLAKKNMACYILAPRGNKKFHRLSVADYETVNQAALKSEQLKGEFGSDVWVIRY
ncbi:MAG: SPOR domain-containing protein [Cyclobacteriaceae bacterium]|nr:SPOR domain-containing protein [Cyclobacteriaceae bacterium]